MKFCVFSRGKTTENGSVSYQRSTWQGTKHLKIEGVFQFFDLWNNYFWNLHKICLLMVVLLSQCKAFSHSPVRLNLQQWVAPCQCDEKARCFFGIKIPVGWQNLNENPNCLDCVGWSKEQCSFTTRDWCLTDRADLTVGPTSSSEKSDRVFWGIATNWTIK